MKKNINTTAKPVPITLDEYVEKNLEELTIKAAEMGINEQNQVDLYEFGYPYYQEYLKNSTAKPLPILKKLENK
jgi:hypothetical protein